MRWIGANPGSEDAIVMLVAHNRLYESKDCNRESPLTAVFFRESNSRAPREGRSEPSPYREQRDQGERHRNKAEIKPGARATGVFWHLK